jgi:hypothetical protein
LGGNEEQLSLSHPEFRDAIATLSAALQNRSKDEIRGEEVRQHRKTMRLARAAVITLTALTLLAAGPTLDKMIPFVDIRRVPSPMHEGFRAFAQAKLSTK